MVPLVSATLAHLLATVRSRGELGTVANWQQHVLPRLFEAPAQEIAAALGRPLPAEASLPRGYDGPERLIVPTLRTLLERGEPLRVEAIALGDVESVQLVWRPLAAGTWTSVPLVRVARASGGSPFHRRPATSSTWSRRPRRAADCSRCRPPASTLRRRCW